MGQVQILPKVVVLVAGGEGVGWEMKELLKWPGIINIQ